MGCGTLFTMFPPLTLDAARTHLLRFIRRARNRLLDRIIIDDRPITPAEEQRLREAGVPLHHLRLLEPDEG